MNVARKEQSYTIDDIYALPEGERAELIDGQIYYMATPSMLHQRLVMEISYRIRVYIGEKKRDCEVFPLHLRQAAPQITIRSYSNIVRQASGNTGLQMLKRIGLQYMISSGIRQRNILFLIKLGQGFLMILKLTFQRLELNKFSPLKPAIPFSIIKSSQKINHITIWRMYLR